MENDWIFWYNRVKALLHLNSLRGKMYLRMKCWSIYDQKIIEKFSNYRRGIDIDLRYQLFIADGIPFTLAAIIPAYLYFWFIFG